MTEGPDAGKLAMLDFGLVAEIPPQDREAMVGAVIHLSNRDWNALCDDFIALNFLPPGCDRCVRVCGCVRVTRGRAQGGGRHPLRAAPGRPGPLFFSPYGDAGGSSSP